MGRRHEGVQRTVGLFTIFGTLQKRKRAAVAGVEKEDEFEADTLKREPMY